MSDDRARVGTEPASTDSALSLRADLGSTQAYPEQTGTIGMDRLICPCCHHSVSTVEEHGTGIHCDKCGNSFRLARMRQGPALDEIRVIGRFQLLERVGQGSFGAVWRARDTQLDRVVALKVPHEHSRECGLDVERLGREARVAAQLRHPGIVRLYEVVALDDVPILVSDFIEGTSLKAVLERRRLTFREGALLVAQIAEALDHAHEHGLVHRDVKPANIMMEYPRRADDRGGPRADEAIPGALGRPIVVDFGLAVRPEADTIMTVDGEIVGTPAYMSPEQAAGTAHFVDRRSDVYSLGVILYQILCGELPFRGSRAMIVHQLLNEEPRPPRKINDRIPRDLETICLKALARLPSRRYATAAELAADLRRYLNGEPCRARPVGRLERGWLWALRNKALASAFAMAAILVAATMAFLALSAAWEKRHSQQLGKALRQTNERLAENYLERGLTLCDRGEVAHGLLLLARGEAVVPEDATDLRRVMQVNLAAWQRMLVPLEAVRRHGKAVTAIAFSADGTMAASGGTDQTVRIWAGAAHEPLGGSIDYRAMIQALAFSPDGTALAIAGQNGTARVWDIPAGRFRPFVFAPGGKILAIAYRHDGKVLAAAGADGRVHLWQTNDGCPIPTGIHLPGSMIRLVAFTPDDRTIVTVGFDGSIRLWDAGTGAPRGPSVGPQKSQIRPAALSADGRWLITGSSDGIATIRDMQTLEVVRELSHPAAVRGVAISPDGRLVLTACADKLARLWDVDSGRNLGPAAYHQEGVAAVAFSRDGRILTGSDDGVCQFRRINPERSHQIELEHRASVGIVAFSPDGRLALTGTKPGEPRTGTVQGETQIWDLATGRARARVTHTRLVTDARFSPDGHTVASAGADGMVRLLDVASGDPIVEPLRHPNWVLGITFSPDGKLLLTACEDGEARLWDVRSGQCLDRGVSHELGICTVAFSPDGKLAASAGAGGDVKLWEVASGRIRHTFRHADLVRTVAFSPDGQTLLSASLDGTARLWRVDTGQPIGEPLIHQDDVYEADFSPDGTMVLTASRDNTAQLWSVLLTRPIGPPLVHQGAVLKAAFSPDRLTVATAGYDATVRFWDIATGRPLGPSLRHDGPVGAMGYSPDGRRLITGSGDRTARIWVTPPSFDAAPLRSLLWIETLSGMELTANEAIGMLTPDQWQERCRQLRELGGPPVMSP